MNLNRLEVYKLIDANQHISIVPAKAHVAGANELIIGSMRDVLIYLNRYVSERMDGKEVVDAHRVALKGAIPVLGDKHGG